MSRTLLEYEWGNVVTETGLRFDGVAEYACLDSETTQEEAAIRQLAHPNAPNSAAFTVRCVRTRVRRATPVKGEARVYAYYGYIRNPNVATIRMSGTLDGRKATHDLDGLDLVGPIRSTTVQGQWVVTRGDPIIKTPRRVMVIESAFNSYADVLSAKGFLGAVNGHDHYKFFDTKAGQLLCTRIEVTNVHVGQQLWYVNMEFVEETLGWNNLTKRCVIVGVPMDCKAFAENGTDLIATDTKAVKLESKRGTMSTSTFTPGVEQDTRVYPIMDYHYLDSILLTEW